MASPSDHETTDASFSALIEGHGDVLGRQILRLSEGAFATFTRLCRTARDAVPRAEVAASLPSHLDAALRRNGNKLLYDPDLMAIVLLYVLVHVVP